MGHLDTRVKKLEKAKSKPIQIQVIYMDLGTIEQDGKYYSPESFDDSGQLKPDAEPLTVQEIRPGIFWVE